MSFRRGFLAGKEIGGNTTPFDIVTACRKKDLATLSLATPLLQKHIPHRKLIVFTAGSNFRAFRNKLGAGPVLVDEDQVVPNMTLGRLRAQGKLPGFPEGAGWYFQQFLKFSYPKLEPEADRYLIWDADTVPLRPIQPFGIRGEACLVPALQECAEPLPGQPANRRTRELLEQATRPHQPYFDNYQHLLGESPVDGRSFVAQHMPILVPCLQSMLEEIEARWPGEEGWAWKIIHNLRGNSVNLFSEYEFYAQYALRHFSSQHCVRRLAWRRGGQILKGQKGTQQIEAWGTELDFVALEAWASPWRRRLVSLYLSLPGFIRGRIRRGV